MIEQREIRHRYKGPDWQKEQSDGGKTVFSGYREGGGKREDANSF